jgi:peptidoglycan/xylan/chitin deacetylase (PgdA/CDA1 family)
MKKVLILNYHKLTEETETLRNNKFHVSFSSFVKQLELIKSKNQKNTIITFDDGNLSDFTLAYPLLKEHGIKGMFFPVINTIGTKDHLAWEQLIEISNDGFEIGSHSVSHRDLTQLSPDEVQKELKESKRIVEEKLGKEIQALALPYGKSNKSILKIAKEEGYKVVYSTNGGVSSPDDFLQHRWNIKSTMSMETFEKILSGNKWTYFSKAKRSNLKRVLDNTTGQFKNSNSVEN